MPIIAIIIIVVVVIILSKLDISEGIITLMITSMFSLLAGGATAGIASLALTPFLGVPMGLFVGIYTFSKLMRRR